VAHKVVRAAEVLRALRSREVALGAASVVQLALSARRSSVAVGRPVGRISALIHLVLLRALMTLGARRRRRRRLREVGALVLDIILGDRGRIGARRGGRSVGRSGGGDVLFALRLVLVA
jgi:hypothetical protein